MTWAAYRDKGRALGALKRQEQGEYRWEVEHMPDTRPDYPWVLTRRMATLEEYRSVAG